MAKTNFSQDQQKAYELALDLARGDFSLKDGLSKADLEQHLRDTINNDILKGKTMYQALRYNAVTVFEIIEAVVNTALAENIITSPFMDTFVEVKNLALGDKNEFYSEGGLLSVAKFAGNHWDTNRQSLDLGSVTSLTTEWVYIHAYEDLERFLKGIAPMEKVMDKVYKSFNKYVQDRLYAQFALVANSVPSDFADTANDLDSLGALVDKVMAAGGYNSVTLAGTKGAIRKIANLIPERMWAESMREAQNMGAIPMWEGNRIMPIPQTLQSGTFTAALSDTEIYILGGETKPIKMVLEGDSRTEMDFTGKMHNDQSVDMQVQTKVGMGLILPPYFGKFTYGT